jgi:ribulose 1,5-bisphosphate carboxylase large subunit-like protein
MFQITIVQKIKTQFMISKFFFSETLPVYEKMSKDMVEPERPQKIRQMSVACWISKATRSKAPARARALSLSTSLSLSLLHTHKRAHALTHSLSLSLSLSHTHTHTQKYVILIAFPLQQLFGECISILCCTHNASLVETNRK